MATNKKAISAYIPSDIEEYLIKYCTEYDITRKDKSGEIKPALGTAVVEILRIFFSNENVPSPLPDNVPLLPSNVITEDRLSKAIADLRSNEEFLKMIAAEVQKISTVAEDYQENPNDNVTEEAKIEEDKASLAPIFEDEDEEEVNFNSCTVSHLRKIVTIKGLCKKFREKLGKSPGNAKKAEIVKFLNETSIWDTADILVK